MLPLSILTLSLGIKFWILRNQSIEFSFFTILALAGQDFLLAAVFVLIDKYFPKRIGITCYFLVTIWVASNLVLYQILGTPLSHSTLSAAGGALSDSFGRYLNLKTLTPFVLVVFFSIVLLFIFRKVKPRPKLLFVYLSLFMIGQFCLSRTRTFGLQRNFAFAFFESFLSFSPKNSSLAHEQIRKSEFSFAPSELSEKVVDQNVFIIVLESTAARYLKPYGSKVDTMPTLTRLAHQSLLFEKAYTVYPESIKGLFATLCSRAPLWNQPAQKLENYKGECFPETFRKAGYHTSMFHSGRFDYLDMDFAIKNRGFEVLRDANDLSGGEYVSFGVSDELTVVKKIFEHLDKQNKKFLMMYLPIAGHHPYLTPRPGPFNEIDEEHSYYNSIHHADEALAEILKQLKKRNWDKNTIVVIYGDHGEAFYQHPNNYAHTLQIYEENVHVPLVIYNPKLKSKRVSDVTSLLDLGPTLLAISGLVPQEANNAKVAPFFTDYSQKLAGLRDQNYKFIFDFVSKQALLFDLSKDPAEQKNISQENLDLARRYREKIEAWVYEASRPY